VCCIAFRFPFTEIGSYQFVINKNCFCHIDSATESIRMLCLFKCQSSHQHSSEYSRFKGAVSEWDLRDFWRQPRLQKAIRSDGRAIIGDEIWKSSERARRVAARLFQRILGFVEPVLSVLGCPQSDGFCRLSGSDGRAWHQLSHWPFLHGSPLRNLFYCEPALHTVKTIRCTKSPGVDSPGLRMCLRDYSVAWPPPRWL
jgi:hypothetical protein